MNKYKQYLADVQSFVESLSSDQAIAYAIIAAKRFFGFYSEFSKKEAFGDLEILKLIQESATEQMLKGETRSDLAEIIDAMDGMIPDSEEFDNSTDALDSGSIHFCLATFLISQDKENIKHIANLIYDISDRYAQALIDSEMQDRKFEEAVESHPILVENLNNERAIFREISSVQSKSNLLECINKSSKIQIRTS